MSLRMSCFDRDKKVTDFDDLFEDAETVAQELGNKITILPRTDVEYMLGVYRDDVPVPSPSTAEDRTEFKKTCKMLLEEGSRRVLGRSPEYETAVLSSDDGKKLTFFVTCRVGARMGVGKARIAQEARHTAAASVLRKIILDGLHKEYCIPGDTKEEAYEHVRQLMPGPSIGKALDAEENWIGTLNELCQQAKCLLPQYEEQRLDDGTFQVVCKCQEREARGSATNKKAAKNLAAQSMFFEVHHSLREKAERETVGQEEGERDQGEEGSESIGTEPGVE
uniref:DRBM domain-containing protein n=1 Tax=Steinernema glaseri TaxID=37863 RepID=A0A1I7ZQ18_9BILA